MQGAISQPQTLEQMAFEPEIQPMSQLDHQLTYARAVIGSGRAALQHLTEKASSAFESALDYVRQPRKATALAGTIATLATVGAAAEGSDTASGQTQGGDAGAQTTMRYYPSSSKFAIRKVNSIAERCHYKSAKVIPYFGKSKKLRDDNTKYGRLKYRTMDEGDSTIRKQVSWTYKKGYQYCGSFGFTLDYETIFPVAGKDMQDTKKGGQLTDPYTNKQNNGHTLRSFYLFFKKRNK